MPTRAKPAPPPAPAPAPSTASAKPWEHAKGGEGSAQDPIAMRFVESLSYDTRLYDADIRGSLAHAQMLEQVGLITRSDLDAIRRGLTEIKSEIESANVTGWSGWKVELEDVHMCIEAALIAKVGDPGRKLHTGRSRNDQVALDLRLWLRDASAYASAAVQRVQSAMIALAARDGDIILPGYTHMQRAQPITVGAELNAWCAMLARDAALLAAGAVNAADCPLGSGALAGSSLSIDRDATAAALGFSNPSASSIDSTASRDEALDFLYALARTAMHLSRWAEQWILYCTTEFGFLKLDGRYTTGSSMMPQKRNPDMLELIRGRCGGVYGHLNSLLTICKGLPIGYNRDLQEDKRHVFAAFDTVVDCLEMAARIAETAGFDQDRIFTAGGGLERGYLDATALADHLVTAGVPFRTAHQVVGALVHLCDSTGRTSLRELTVAELTSAVRERGFENATFDAAGIIAKLGSENVVRAYRTHGHAGTGPRGYRQFLLGSAETPSAPPPAAPRSAPAAAKPARKPAPSPAVTPAPTMPMIPAAGSPVRPQMPMLRTERPAAAMPTLEADKPASLFGPGSAEEDSGATVSNFSQQLIEAYVQVGRTLDDLPYTEEFLNICHLAGAHEAGLGEHVVFRRLQNIRKAGKLPPIGRAPSKPPRISEAEEQWIRQAVEESVGSLGQRDQLPFTPRFDTILQRFNQASGRSLDPHDLWRVIAKIAK
jgi:argininosuccinate lyase